ncbi:MAG: SLBB domain-containing protein [Nitrospirota bacterium]
MRNFSFSRGITCITLAIIIFTGAICFAQTGSYKVKERDVILIRVLDKEELTTQTMVSSDGTIAFPYIGTIVVKDLTLSEIEHTITKKLSEGFIKFPVVSVTMTQSSLIKIYTYGEFQKLGEIPYQEGMTVLTAMSLAGGVTQDGYFGRLIVRRKSARDKEYQDISSTSLNFGIIENKKVGELLLQPDDILTVERNKTFLIQGEVKRGSGVYMLEKGITLFKAITIAGGITPDALYGKIKLRRKKEGTSEYRDKEIDVSDITEGVSTSDIPLQADDIIIVERNKTFFIHGEVARTGEFVLEKGMTVVRALSVAGGINAQGLYGKVKLRRKDEGSSEYRDMEIDVKGITEDVSVNDTLLQADDVIIVERSKSFFMHGEVVRTGEFVLEKDMTVMRAISVAGGVTSDGKYGKIKLRRKVKDTHEYKEIIIDLKQFIENNLGEDIMLEPEDILIVERNKTYFIYGESNRPGEYVLKEDLTVSNAISIAGGFTKWGSPSRVEIVRDADDGGKVKIKINFTDIMDGKAPDVLLKAGDTIILSAGVL